MHFDDRLQTLLAAPVADAHDRAVRWRQLVDLLARVGPASGAAAGGAIDEALELVRREAFAIDEDVRAATLRAIAGQNVAPALLHILAAQPVRIAAPLFAGLSLSDADAAHILADADDEVRALVRIKPAPVLEPGPEPEPKPAPEPSISDMVSRIEQLQRQRAPSARPASPPPRPAPAKPQDERLFEWESDASGHIAWVAGAPRGALIGRPLDGDGGGLLEREVASRLAQRHPFVDVPVALGEPLTGTWRATGVPAFDPSTGRFIGYCGLARRIDGQAPLGPQKREPDLDALREMVHEIKTPLNAIIGFAEIIDGQYLGPAHRLYRERAASIVGQARQLLDAVEDLDFAAKLRAGRGASEQGAGAAAHGAGGGGSLSQLFPPIVAEIEQCLAANGGVLELDIDQERHRCALSPDLATRLLRRLLLSLCQIVANGEVFRIAVTRRGGMCLLTIARPHLLDGTSEAQLVDPAFAPSGGDEEQGVGLGFALRLVRGLARAAGGSLVIDEHRITLELPALDG